MSNSCGGGSVLEGGGVVAVGMMWSVRVCSGAGGGDGRFQPFEIHPVLCVISVEVDFVQSTRSSLCCVIFLLFFKKKNSLIIGEHNVRD